MGLLRSCVEINLGAIAHNLREIRNKLGRGVRVLAVVKSDAYGHGAKKVGLLLERRGVDMLGVASAEEGADLREKGIRLPILVLGCIFPEEIEKFFSYSLIPNLCELDLAKKFSRHAVRLGQTIKVHTKVDTGMGGLGVRAQRASSFVQEVVGLPGLVVEGLFTHFNSATESNGIYTREQLNLFRGVVEELGRMGIHIPLRHAANSGAILRSPESYMSYQPLTGEGLPCTRTVQGRPPATDTPLNMVRTGLLLYGLTPPGCREFSIDLRPAMTFKTRLAYIKDLEPGETVSYGRSFTAGQRTRIGVLPVGYDSGYSLRLSNKGYVVIRDKRFPVVGRVRMNLIHVDLGQEEAVEIGDVVTLYGGEGPSVEEIAGIMMGSPYEVLCATGKANPRTYVEESEVEDPTPGAAQLPHCDSQPQLMPLCTVAH
ncbi:MAG TPA: alanine racemase [Candidatus Tripitaka californicus]|uniref:alanine racemase n=1 Tax=Candidatus Tripitaka californicus TaxID=3367616 RepID=UPI00402894B3|nr:alanine racemase [Planctomycetota bacterium]